MELKTYFAQDAAGNIISSAIVNVFLQGTTTLATGLTRADGTPLENPFAADGAGRIQFRAPDGYYDVQVSTGSGIIQTLTIQCVDYSEAKSAAEQAQSALNSITGINTNFEQNSREQWRRSLAEAGLTLVSGSFEEGATVTKATDAVWHIAGGKCYTWGGTLPKTVPATSTPGSTGGVSSGAWGSVGDAALRTELASVNGAMLSLSQVATAYGLDFSLGGVWHAGATSSVDNWWWHGNKVYTGGVGALPSEPSAPWYPIRPGHKLNLTDFITSNGASDILDTVDWQWAFDSAKLNARHTTIIDMDGREYAVTGGGYVMHQGVSLRGARDAMLNPSVDGLSIVYINKTPSASDVIFILRGGNLLEDFGVYYAQQTYAALSAMVDVGILFKKLPGTGGADAINTKGCTVKGVSACGVSKFYSGSYADNAPGEYDDVSRVAVTPTPYGPSFRLGISTDLLRYQTIHINANVVSAYRAKYGVDISPRALPSSYTSCVGFLVERADGCTIHDILTYGVPYPVVLGAVGTTGGAHGCSVNLSQCAFDATQTPVYINCPTGAFGVQLSNCQVVFDEQFGDSNGQLVYLGSSASNHQVSLSNIKVQMTPNYIYRPVRAVSESNQNRIMFSNCALTGSANNLDEGTGNRISLIQSTRNLGNLNLMTNLTPESSLVSSMGELNTIVRHSVSVTVQQGATFANIPVTYPYSGFLSAPNVKTEITSVSISGQSDDTMYTSRAYGRSQSGCVIRVNLSKAAVAAGELTVDLYLIGTVRGELTSV